MTNVTQIADHSIRAISRLTSQFQGQTNVEALVEMFMDELNELETSGFQLLLQRSLAVGVGEQLDTIGSHVGLLRGGRSDDDYRVALYGKIVQNSSDGSQPTIYSMVKQISGATSVQVIDQYPAAVKIIVNSGPLTNDQKDSVRLALGAGISLDSISPVPDPSEFFTLGSVISGDPTTGLGMSTVSPAVASPTGGKLTTV